jgi:hypothetical protein
MSSHRPPRRAVLALFLAAGTAGLLWTEAAADAPLTAKSVCEAQELKARLAKEPGLAIQIPPEFDKAWPSLDACRSHDAAWDESAPGPNQPIPFSHKHHAGTFQIECAYCHSGTDRSRAAGVPSVELCMGCHAQFPAEYDELEGIQILKQHWEQRKTIPWTQIHWVPDYVKFQHQAHVRAGLDCQTCHGPVQELDKLYLVPDTQWWQYGLPTQKLEMGWCIMCHRDKGASQDCVTCHY